MSSPPPSSLGFRIACLQHVETDREDDNATPAIWNPFVEIPKNPEQELPGESETISVRNDT